MGRRNTNSPPSPSCRRCLQSKMDILRLQKYERRPLSNDKEVTPLKNLINNKKGFQSNNSLNDKGINKYKKEFTEFFINDKPLSKLLDNFYNTKTSILDNWTGVLGTNQKKDVVKIKQLLNKEVTDKDIRQIYPASWSDDEFKWYLEKYREELVNPEILIYCCSECGDTDCGGITIKIKRTNSSVIWTIKDDKKELNFEFDKYSYFDVLNNYLKMVSK
jgi:hypothetical protein